MHILRPVANALGVSSFALTGLAPSAGEAEEFLRKWKNGEITEHEIRGKLGAIATTTWKP